MLGTEYTCGNLQGEEGQSLRVNTVKGVWKDFATDEGGSDLISLFAAIENIGQGEAAKRLAADIGFELGARPKQLPAKRDEQSTEELTAPPANLPVPPMEHRAFGAPSHHWTYCAPDGSVLFFVARYEPPNSAKQFIPWSWSKTQNRFVQKAPNAPRPLYGLEVLASKPDAPVLIVEGEKAADSARTIAGHIYAVISWPNGAKAISKANWSPVYGRKILIWPDADEPGLRAAQEIGTLLYPHCPEIKLLDPSDHADGWDAADALLDGWDWARFRDWAKQRVSVYTPAIEPEVLEATPVDKTVNVNVTVSEDTSDVPVSLYAIYEQCGVAVSKNGGHPIADINNIGRVFRGFDEFKDFVWFDEFHQKYFTKWQSDHVREWNDIWDLKLTSYFQEALGFRKLSDDLVNKAVRLYGDQNRKNEPRDWMETLTWDGVSRLEAFLSDAFGCSDTPYTRAAGKNWWIGMVARIYQPGCKVDNMIILEGGQGKFKSTALNVIGGPWYTENHEQFGTKDFYQALQGKLIIEIGELDAFSRAEVTTIKRVITCQSDRYRPSYGRVAQDFPRRCIFVGTTNEDNYLRDSTGARRFWPIRIEQVDLGYLREMRSQFFAEAVHLMKAGHTWYEMPKGSTEEQQELRRQSDEWEGVIAEYMLTNSDVTATTVGVQALKIEVGKLDKSTQMRIAKVLRIIGCTSRQVRRHGAREWLWSRASVNQDSDAPQ